jgi:hypothetical protein
MWCGDLPVLCDDVRGTCGVDDVRGTSLTCGVREEVHVNA